MTHADLPAPGGINALANPLQHGRTAPSVILHADGSCQVQATETGSYDVSTFALDGSSLGKASLQLAAGTSQTVSLGLEQAPAGIYLVQVRSQAGSSFLKYVK